MIFFTMLSTHKDQLDPARSSRRREELLTSPDPWKVCAQRLRRDLSFEKSPLHPLRDDRLPPQTNVAGKEAISKDRPGSLSHYLTAIARASEYGRVISPANSAKP